MSTTDWYFKFTSPYSYLAAKGIAAIGAKHDRVVAGSRSASAEFGGAAIFLRPLAKSVL